MGIEAYPEVSAHQEPPRVVVTPLQPQTWGATAQATPGWKGTHTPVAEQPADSL